MEKSTKALRRISDTPALDVVDLLTQLARALVGKGPALGFGDISAEQVPDRVAVVIASSGSTGERKEVGLSASALLSSATASNKNLGARHGQVWSLLLPLTHIAGVNVLVRSLELGTAPLDLRRATTYPKADFTAIVPTQLFRALNGDGKLLQHLQNCRAVLVGGAALSDSLLGKAQENGIKIVSTYGMSETSGGCIYDGYPLEGVQLRIEAGVIQIKGLTLATTYINNEQAWQESLIEGWFVTNDLGEYSSGKLQVLGRSDEVVITGAEKVSLQAIEDALSAQYPGIEFAGFFIAEEEWGQALHVALTGIDSPTDNEIILTLSSALGEAAKPKGIIRLATLPRTSIGKVDRKVLQALVGKTDDIT